MFKLYINKIRYFWLSVKVGMLNRHKRVVNFNSIKTAKVFSQINNSEDYNSLVEFLILLNKKNIKFSAVCYSDDKEKLRGFVRSVDLFSADFIFISPGDIGFLGKKDKDITDYLNRPSDVFIDLCMEDSFTADYIAGLVITGFKVGSYSRKSQYHDLIIDVKNNRNISYLSKQIEHYLTMIRPAKT